MTTLEARRLSLLVTAGRYAIASCVCYTAFSNGAPAAAMFAAAELVGCIQAVWNDRYAIDWDTRSEGLVVPMVYLLSAFFITRGPEGFYFSLAGCAFAALEIATRLSAWSSYTASTCNWVMLRDRGPFAIVRHPMSSSAILCRLWLTLGHFSAINLAASVAWLLLTLWRTRVEEFYLASKREWWDYAYRVPSRFLPGDWVILGPPPRPAFVEVNRFTSESEN